MNSFKRLIATFAVALPILLAGFGGSASAMVKYDPNGTPTAKTPVFNQYFDVPNGVGDESDFVRVKPQAGTNADYVNRLSSACSNNDAYTVRTYIHNGADPSFNDGGNGTAVAHNVNVRMAAPLGSINKNFIFTSAVSASNASTVSDNGYLDCAQSVKLDLVSGSVKVYSSTLGWRAAPDSAVNGVLPVSSHVAGSGDVWACWEERVIVTYDVKVSVIPVVPPVTPPVVVTPPSVTPPTTLVKTGPGDVAAIFAATSIAGMAAYQVFVTRRLSRQ